MDSMLGIFKSYVFAFGYAGVFAAAHGLSLGAGSRGSSPVSVPRLLTAAASPAVEHGP